jgi:hypothetical protein
MNILNRFVDHLYLPILTEERSNRDDSEDWKWKGWLLSQQERFVNGIDEKYLGHNLRISG